MNYSEKLKDPRWQKKRLQIFERDQWMCDFCKSSSDTLVVHHLCYFPHTEPWDHDDNFMVTLCEPCHEAGVIDSGVFRTFYLLRAALCRKRSELECLLEEEFDKELSHRLDCVLYLLGV
jgi:hypothetical protein